MSWCNFANASWIPPIESMSPSSTACPPTRITMRDKYNVMISGCFDVLAGKVIRIGHMGENANVDDMAMTLDAMDKTFADLGYELGCSMKEEFLAAM